MAKIFIFTANFNFWPTFLFLDQISIFDQNLPFDQNCNFWPIFKFVVQISIFDKNVYFSLQKSNFRGLPAQRNLIVHRHRNFYTPKRILRSTSSRRRPYRRLNDVHTKYFLLQIDFYNHFRKLPGKYLKEKLFLYFVFNVSFSPNFHFQGKK